MMSADDEPQITLSKSNSQNNLINEAFNLNANNLKPLNILPPSSNHFQPISHNRTPSTEIKDLKLTAALKAPPISNHLFINSQNKTPNSFFDEPISDLGHTFPSCSPPVLKKTPEPTEIQNKNESNFIPSNTLPSTIPVSIQKPPSLASAQQHNRTPSNGILHNFLPPPISLPPTSLPTSIGSSGSSNPYAAKGALTQKVYNSGINVAQVAQPATDFLKSPPTSNQSQLTSNQGLFMPPVPQSTQPNPNTQPIIQTSQSYHQFPVIQPSSIGLEDRFNSNSVNVARSNSQTNNGLNNQLIQSDSNQNQNQNETQHSEKESKWMNWISGISQTKIVSNLKSSVESIMTTVDPQMSNYNHPANRPLYLLSSISTPKIVHLIREAFNNVGFSKISINSLDAQNSSQFAPQIIGFPCALQSAREKLENSLIMMQDAECTVISIQDFIAELTTDCWFELAVIMLKDKRKNIEMTIYTEGLPVSPEDIAQLQQFTPNDFNLKWSGLSCRLPEKNFNFNALNPNQVANPPFLAYDTSDTLLSNERLSHALKVIATQFKNKMLAQM